MSFSPYFSSFLTLPYIPCWPFSKSWPLFPLVVICLCIFICECTCISCTYEGKCMFLLFHSWTVLHTVYTTFCLLIHPLIGIGLTPWLGLLCRVLLNAALGTSCDSYSFQSHPLETWISLWNMEIGRISEWKYVGKHSQVSRFCLVISVASWIMFILPHWTKFQW